MQNAVTPKTKIIEGSGASVDSIMHNCAAKEIKKYGMENAGRNTGNNDKSNT